MTAPTATSITGMRGPVLGIARMTWVAGVALALTVAVVSFIEFFTAREGLLVRQGPLALQPSVAPELQILFDADFIDSAQKVVHLLGITVFAVVGFGLFARGSDDWLRSLTSLMLLTTGVALFSPSSVLVGADSGWEPWVEAVGVLVPGPEIWRSVSGVALLVFALVFPDGRVGPRWAAIPMGLILVHIVLWAALPFAFFDPREWPGDLTAAWTLAPIILATGAQLHRYSFMSPPEVRVRTRLVVVALAAAAAIFVLLWAVEPRLDPGVFDLVLVTRRLQALYDLNLLVLLTATVMLLPFAISISVVRHGLWDIDLIVSRTVAYGTLTGIVATTFFVGLVGVGSLLTRFIAGGRGVAGVATGVLIVVAFQPLRHRIQRAVDRRFYREKYDAEAVAEAFARSVVDVIDVDAVETMLVDAVDQTLHPARLKVWRPDRDEALEQELSDHLIGHPNRSVVADELRLPLPEAMRGFGRLVPMVAQGDMVGVLAVGPLRAGRDPSSIDVDLLERLGRAAAPALRLALLVRQQAQQAEEQVRLDSEMEVARRIQLALLPHRLPSPKDWSFQARYEPARRVGGDYYDVLELPHGRIGLLVADVSGKGIPAAMVMATTRTVFRSEAPSSADPAATLAAMNRRLEPDLSPGMFATCFYAVLDPSDGKLAFANAGHPLPVLRRRGGEAEELHSTGMPLGWLPDTTYDAGRVTLTPGDLVLFHSDGVVEARAPDGSLYGTERLLSLVGEAPDPLLLLDRIVAAVQAHCGPGVEPDDDITLLSVSRGPSTRSQTPDSPEVETLTVYGRHGAEREAADWVRTTLAETGLSRARADALYTAVAEAVLNAMEHGNRGQPDLPVELTLRVERRTIRVTVTDRGPGPVGEAEQPDLEAKLAGDQSPRGWGRFLVDHLVDEVQHRTTAEGHTVELAMRTET